MTNITIEQLRSDKWVAEVEVGGFVAKREHLTAASRHEIIMLVMQSCDKLEAQDPRKIPVRAPVSYEDVDPPILADEMSDERLPYGPPVVVVPAAEVADLVAAGVDPRRVVMDEKVPEELDKELRKTEDRVAETYHNEPETHIEPEAASARSLYGPHIKLEYTAPEQLKDSRPHNLPKRGRPRKS